MRVAEPAPAGGRAGAAQRRDAAREPGDRCGRARQPAVQPDATSRRTRRGSSPTGSATRSGSRSGPARARSGSPTSAGASTRRSTASPAPTVKPTPELRVALLRRSRPELAVRYRTSTCARRCTPTPRRRRPTRTSRTSTASRLGRGRHLRAPAGGSSVIGASRSHRRTELSRARTDGALFFADNARNCIWVETAGANGLPSRSTRHDVRRRLRQPVPGRPRGRPGLGGHLLRQHRRRADPPDLVPPVGPAARGVPHSVRGPDVVPCSKLPRARNR